MKILKTSLMIVAAAGIGLAVGFALRGKFRGTPDVEPTAVMETPPSPPQMTTTSAFFKRAGVRVTDDMPLATQLERDLSMSSGVTRWLYWLEAIENARPSDFPRLARLAQAEGNSTVARLIAARWLELDPRHLFDTLVAAASKDRRGFPSSELAAALFQEWPKRDPEAVIAAMNELRNFGRLDDWRMRVATTLLETDVERGLRAMSEWRYVNHGPNMKVFTKWAAANPRHAAEFTIAHPAGHASRAAMSVIGKEWAKTDPGRALAFAATQRGELGSSLATSVAKEWASRNLTEAVDWLASTDALTRNRLSPSFVEAWAKQDAGSALTWCESNLTGRSLAQAVGGLLKGAADKDVVGAAGLVAGMNSSPARGEAAMAVAQNWFPQFGSGKSVAPETLEWLATLDADSVKRVLEGMQWQWASNDPKSMAAFLASTPTDRIPDQVYSTLARNLARENPSEAFAWVSRLPEDRRLSAGSEAFTAWCRSQPEAALNGFRDLPPADPRREPFLQNAMGFLAFDPHAAEQFSLLADSDRAIARKVIETMILPAERRAWLLDALKPR